MSKDIFLLFAILLLVLIVGGFSFVQPFRESMTTAAASKGTNKPSLKPTNKPSLKPTNKPSLKPTTKKPTMTSTMNYKPSTRPPLESKTAKVVRKDDKRK